VNRRALCLQSKIQTSRPDYSAVPAAILDGRFESCWDRQYFQYDTPRDCAKLGPHSKTLFSIGLARQGILIFLMEYRGKNYLIFEGDGPSSWRWAVTLDDVTTKTGEAKTRSAAVTEVVLAVDRALAKSNVPR
jgi:hypothetical protein